MERSHSEGSAKASEKDALAKTGFTSDVYWTHSEDQSHVSTTVANSIIFEEFMLGADCETELKFEEFVGRENLNVFVKLGGMFLKQSS